VSDLQKQVGYILTLEQRLRQHSTRIIKEIKRTQKPLVNLNRGCRNIIKKSH
jgi:hypothetical protein